RRADARQLRPVLHAAQAQDVAQYADRRGAGRPPDRGRVDRRRGRARPRRGGAVLDPVSVAAAAFPGARLDLPGRLPPRRARHALVLPATSEPLSRSMILAALLLVHGDDPGMELLYFWAAVLLALTPVLIFGTIGALVLKKIWKERRGKPAGGTAGEA